jgi:hypothetical protein
VIIGQVLSYIHRPIAHLTEPNCGAFWL